MTIYCPQCGTPYAVNALAEMVCTRCGARFTPAAAPGGQAGAPPGAAPYVQPPRKGGTSTLTIVLIVVGCILVIPCVIGLIGVLAAIAIPNYIHYQARSRQSEAKMNLKALYTAERAYFAEQDKLSDDFVVLGALPERRNRYAYFIDADGPVQYRNEAAARSTAHIGFVTNDVTAFKGTALLTPDVVRPTAEKFGAGLHGTCPDCSVTIVAVGNIDTDATLDVWSISTVDRTADDGSTIPAGVPHNDVNDVDH